MSVELSDKAKAKKIWPKCFTFLERFEAPEFRVMAIKEAMRSARSVVVASKEFFKFTSQHADVITG
jgi:hypothetical protein